MLFPHPRWLHRSWCLLLPLVGSLGCTSADTESNAVAQTASTLVADSIATAALGTDDFGAPVPTDAQFAARVVSLNPAATEVIFAIGADSLLVGRSRWDTFPNEALRVADVGDGIRPNIEAVLAVRPTLVVLYATAENRNAAAAFERAGVRTLALRVDHIAQFHRMVAQLGRALGADARARIVSDSVQQTLDRVSAVTRNAIRKRVVWPVWESPVMVIGRGSYLDELITIAGGNNAFHDLDAPSPSVSIEEIAKRNPDVVITSAPRAAELAVNAQWRVIPAVRAKQFVVHDPTVTGRPSVVLGMGAVQLARALHPELADQLR